MSWQNKCNCVRNVFMCGFHNFIFFNHDWQNVYCYYNHILYFLFLYQRTNLTMLWKNTHFFHYVEIRYFLMWLLITKLIVMKLFSKIDIMCPLALFSCKLYERCVSCNSVTFVGDCLFTSLIQNYLCFSLCFFVYTFLTLLFVSSIKELCIVNKFYLIQINMIFVIEVWLQWFLCFLVFSVFWLFVVL